MNRNRLYMLVPSGGVTSVHATLYEAIQYGRNELKAEAFEVIDWGGYVVHEENYSAR